VRNKKNMDNNNGNGYLKRLLKLLCGRVGLQVGSFVIEPGSRGHGIGQPLGLTKRDVNGETFFIIRLNHRGNASSARKKSHSRAETLKKSG
jgi:hypothetical protein